MNPSLIKTMYRPIIKRAAYGGLVGRNRDRDRLDKGRFTRGEVEDILIKTWAAYDQFAPSVPQEPKFGNRMNILLACITLSCFRVLMSAGIERAYAIELIGDVAWKVYEKWGRLPILLARFSASDPRQRMRIAVNLFLRFPFTPPGYVFERTFSDEGIAIEMLRCPVADYTQAQDASDLCVGTWCNLDFALAEMWGGWLERTETLAAGCAHCDFHFKAPARQG